MRILDTLSRLAARRPTPWPVLSVYVNTRPVGPLMTTYRPFLRKRGAEELTRFPARSPERESLTVDLARAQHYLDHDLRDSTRSVALFACYAGDDVFDAIQLPLEFPDHQVTVGALPTLYPLLRMADRASRTAVAVVEEGAARLFTLSMGAVEVRREVRRRVASGPAPDSEGPPELARRSARALEELAQDTAAAWLAVGGESAAAAEVLAALPPGLAPRLLETAPWDPRIPEAELAAAVSAEVDRRERERRIEEARRLADPPPGEGGALGVEAVRAALQDDLVHTLLLGESLPGDAPAWGCLSCRSFGPGTPPASCPTCGRDTIEAIPLREQLGARALAHGAVVHFVPDGAVSAFDDGGRVGALLR